MRALQQVALEGPGGLRLVDIPLPRPGRGEVLIRVAAAGINFVDVARARGTFGDNPTPPFVAGFEAAGEVVRTGDGVTSPVPGPQVIAAGPGAFAEYMLVPAAGAMPTPAGWTTSQALGLVINWPTARTCAARRLYRRVRALRSGIARRSAARRRDPRSNTVSRLTGRPREVHALARHLRAGHAGDWKLAATIANGQPAATVYRRDAQGILRADGIVLLAATAGGVARVVAFHHDPVLVALFE
jgi:alcohol dehydrogenase-like protein